MAWSASWIPGNNSKLLGSGFKGAWERFLGARELLFGDDELCLGICWAEFLGARE